MAAGLDLTRIKEEQGRIMRFVIPGIGRLPMARVSVEDIPRVITEITKTNTNAADAVRASSPQCRKFTLSCCFL